jgi:hypothetical protein
MLKMAKIPIVAETVIGWVGTEGMVKSAGRDFYDPGLAEHFVDRYRDQMRYKGFKRALLSTIRNNMLDSFVNSYEQVGKMDIPFNCSGAQ